jgi:hypothetical protein
VGGAAAATDYLNAECAALFFSLALLRLSGADGNGLEVCDRYVRSRLEAEEGPALSVARPTVVRPLGQVGLVVAANTVVHYARL